MIVYNQIGSKHSKHVSRSEIQTFLYSTLKDVISSSKVQTQAFWAISVLRIKKNDRNIGEIQKLDQISD